jgi:hypothetical protein
MTVSSSPQTLLYQFPTCIWKHCKDHRRTEIIAILTCTRSPAFATTLLINTSAELKPFSCRPSYKNHQTQKLPSKILTKTDAVSKENRWSKSHVNICCMNILHRMLKNTVKRIMKTTQIHDILPIVSSYSGCHRSVRLDCLPAIFVEAWIWQYHSHWGS